MAKAIETAPHHTTNLPWFLRAPRSAGLWLVGVLIPVATAAGFILSYRGLYDWAIHHGWPWYLAPLFPLLIDLLIIAGEVVLFVAAIDGDTPRLVRGWAWAITVVFTGLSVAGNVSHAATADVPTRVGWALPPVVLALALGFGLGILKRQAAKYRAVPVRVPVRVPAAKRETVQELGARWHVRKDTVPKMKAYAAEQVRVALADAQVKATQNGDSHS
jgi:hypothetical protein